MSIEPIPEHAWPRLLGATATLLGPPTTAGPLLQAVQAYRLYGLNTTVPDTCRTLGYGIGRRRDVLLYAAAGLSPAEITRGHETGILPGPVALRMMSALLGRGALPEPRKRPKSRRTSA